ncbi:MAG: NADH-quinone oxidoreductase subunit C [Verrucomicrobiae bacterium]|nr:NADH-quinone oxidoreductase subunit C [Verrucomicrobiae bacterium]
MSINNTNTPKEVASPLRPGVHPLAHLALPFEAVDYHRRGVHFEAQVEPAQVVLAAVLMDQEGFALDAVTGVDWPQDNQMEVIYDYFHPALGWRAAVRTRVSRGLPEVPSISAIFPGANWHEREAWEFFGIHFTGHPNLTPLLLPDDADYHPLRKDFAAA